MSEAEDMSTNELLDSVEGNISDARWALLRLAAHLPECHLPAELGADLGVLLRKFEQLRVDCSPPQGVGVGSENGFRGDS